MIALIPARAGSKRIPGKNTKLLAGVPLISYTIAAAQQSGVFEDIIVSTDSQEAITIATAAGVKVSYRLPDHATDDAPDILWVRHVLSVYPTSELPESFAILRPTSPFRTAETIRRANAQFGAGASSLRAVARWSGPHPAKMWYLRGDFMEPVDRGWTVGAPYHSSPTQLLPRVVRQNASLEMAYTAVITGSGTIAGHHVAPFFTEGYEGEDINDEEDWARVEMLIASGHARLPEISR